jgi:hypothetical protein
MRGGMFGFWLSTLTALETIDLGSLALHKWRDAAAWPPRWLKAKLETLVAV